MTGIRRNLPFKTDTVFFFVQKYGVPIDLKWVFFKSRFNLQMIDL